MVFLRSSSGVPMVSIPSLAKRQAPLGQLRQAQRFAGPGGTAFAEIRPVVRRWTPAKFEILLGRDLWMVISQWEIFRTRSNGGTLVPYAWPYFVGILPYIGLRWKPYYMVGTCNLGSWNGHWISVIYWVWSYLIIPNCDVFWQTGVGPNTTIHWTK